MSSDALGYREYPKRLPPKNRVRGDSVPHNSTAARAALEEHVLALFSSGKNTMQIAAMVNLSEAQVYNVLARLGA
jgi:DNA-binding CsgD family transcriptional regulator